MMICIACAGLFIPLVGALILLLSADYISRRLTNGIGCLSILLSFACFAGFLFFYINTSRDPEIVTLYNWISVEGLKADFALRLDHLSLLMTLIITGVGFLIHVFSIGYMEHDEDYARFFACMNFFVFAMLLLVLGANLLLLFVGWEGVGLASYLLIGYYYHRPAAAAAATKAFVINRIGDFGFLVGLLLTFYLFGTSDIAEISQRAGQQFQTGAPILVVLTLLYFLGATGKSAQIPLQTWLPDAMEGPTPVSALIHAATMVTAGVYLVVRLHSVFMLTPLTLQIIGVIGGLTALYAALCAVGQTDLKRVLAYSTVSQLGLMFLACGAAAFYSAMFHLTMHAFVKATLFLSAGNVVHMMNGSTNMEKMGGLAKKFPVTHWLFLIGVLALSGIPPLATFFSKDLILEQEYLAGFDTLFYTGLVASILTGFYLMRAYCLTFLGTPRLEDKILKTVREAPRVMLIPVTILALLSIFGGFLGFEIGKTPLLEGFLAEVGIKMSEVELTTGFKWSLETFLAIGGAFLGVGSAAYIYTQYADRPLAFLRHSFYIDEIYHVLFVVPLEALSRFIANAIEPGFFDGSINATTQATQGVARTLQKVQSGEIRSYVAWIVVGAVLLLVYFVGYHYEA